MSITAARKAGPAAPSPSEEDLLAKAHLRIAGGRYNTATLAAALNVSRATMTRLLSRMRRDLAREGAELVSARGTRGWHFVILNDEERLRARWRNWKRRNLIGCVKGGRSGR